MPYAHIVKKYIPDGTAVEKRGRVAHYAVSASSIADICHALYFTHALPLKTITAIDERKGGFGFRIVYVFGIPGTQFFIAPSIVVQEKEGFPSITKDIHEASGYERKIKTFFGLEPIGHPHPRGILLHENWPADVHPLRKDFAMGERPKEANTPYVFQNVEGEGIYEIPVGPVHAGIIEPGHFRFSVAGEEIMLLEPKLGYTHKGTEKLFETFSFPDAVRLSERISGDTSCTHALAFCQAMEDLSDTVVPEKAKYLRVIFSELERLANHMNDIGFIMLDTGYSFGGANGARLREICMQWNERLTGSRFLRGVNVIGGVTNDIAPDVRKELQSALKEIQKDFRDVIMISEDSNSLLNRLQGTGKLDRRIAADHGVVGIVARAVGIARDARIDAPYAAYDTLHCTVALENEGDVRARLYVRIKEVYASLEIIEEALRRLPESGSLVAHAKSVLRKNSYGVGWAEGWRGEIFYFVATDAAGKLTRVDVRDPSFLNWTVVGHAGKGNVVPDFPLINKSFNLSYSGNDL